MQEDYDQALRDFRYASAASHSDFSSNHNLGILDQLTGKLDFAQRQYQTAMDMAGPKRHIEYTHLLMWIVEFEQGDGDEANQELSAYLQDETLPKWEWAKNIGFYLLNQKSEADLLATVPSDNSYKSRVELTRAWYFIGVRRQVSGDETGALDAFRKSVAFNVNYSYFNLLAQAQLPKDASIDSGIPLLDSLVQNLGGPRNFFILAVFCFMGVGFSFSILVIGITLLVLANRRKNPSLPPIPRPVGRVPPMK
jgi:lipoprotein NlpI